MTGHAYENEQLQRPSEEAMQQGHEPDVVNARRIHILAAGFTAVVVLVLITVYTILLVLQRVYAPSQERMSHVQPVRTTEGPLVVENQPGQLQELRRAEDELLGSYGWVDQQAGQARIPIDRAMEILADQGLNRSGASDSRSSPPSAAAPPGRAESAEQGQSTPQPEARQPEAQQPETQQPEARQPEAQQPEAQQPETPQPEAQQPEETAR